MRILTINPGSTSTKIGIFNGETLAAKVNITHTAMELSVFPTLIDQLDYRKRLILEAIAKEGFSPADFDGIIGRGGLLRPIESGVYMVDDAMLHDLRIGLQGTHASNLGGLLAHSIAAAVGKDAYIADPVVVDELEDTARVTGHPLIKKPCIFHALNHKAVAKKHCLERGLNYEDVNLIVAHLGGGVSVGLHKKGRVVEVNNALDGEGPFSPERCGSLPAKQVMELCFSGTYTKAEALSMIQPRGGLVAYFGVNDFREAMEIAEKDPAAMTVVNGMLRKVAGAIGYCAACAKGDVDGVLLTGGMAYGKYAVDYITEHVSYIAEVCVYPGEDELWALASGLARVLEGREEAKTY